MEVCVGRYWKLDLPADAVFEEEVDGISVFRSPRWQLSAIVYSEHTVTVGQGDVRLAQSVGPPKGATRLVSSDERPVWMYLEETVEGRSVLRFVTSDVGERLNLIFLFSDGSSVAEMIEIAKKARPDHPRWFRLCFSVDPPLVQLCSALSQFVGLAEGMEAAVESLEPHELEYLLSSALEDDSPETRRAACFAIEELEVISAQLGDRLLSALEDPFGSVVASAAEALWAFGVEETHLIPYLIKAASRDEAPLPHGDLRISSPCKTLAVPERYYPIEMLARFSESGNLDTTTRLRLRGFLKRFQWDESGPVRCVIADFLLALGEDHQSAVAPIVDAIGDEKFSERERHELREWMDALRDSRPESIDKTRGQIQ